MTLKTCRRCNIEKEIDKFENNYQYKDNRQNICRTCRKRERKEGKQRRQIAIKQKILYEGALCQICKISTTMDPTHKTYYQSKAIVDHDHNTGQTRGILCNVCNGALGKFKDSLEIIENAYYYLKGKR